MSSKRSGVYLGHDVPCTILSVLYQAAGDDQNNFGSEILPAVFITWLALCTTASRLISCTEFNADKGLQANISLLCQGCFRMSLSVLGLDTGTCVFKGMSHVILKLDGLKPFTGDRPFSKLAIVKATCDQCLGHPYTNAVTVQLTLTAVALTSRTVIAS